MEVSACDKQSGAVWRCETTVSDFIRTRENFSSQGKTRANCECRASRLGVYFGFLGYGIPVTASSSALETWHRHASPFMEHNIPCSINSNSRILHFSRRKAAASFSSLVWPLSALLTSRTSRYNSFWSVNVLHYVPWTDLYDDGNGRFHVSSADEVPVTGIPQNNCGRMA